ncbi:MAG: hypothetical protein IT317_13720 [Anaerolineales bacterium]|nr:hypothetical protein [Anaerolineales bacterium]
MTVIQKVNHLTVIWGEVLVEIDRRDKGGAYKNNSPAQWVSLLVVAIGQLAVVTFDFGRDFRRGAYRAQLVSLAALVVEAIECLDQAHALLRKLEQDKAK